MQEADRIADLGAVEPRLTLAELLLAGQVKEQLTAIHVLHYQTQAVSSLERIDQAGYEWVLKTSHHFVLSFSVHYLVLFDDQCFFKDLHGAQSLGRVLPAQDHLAEGALAKDLQELKIMQCLGK